MAFLILILCEVLRYIWRMTRTHGPISSLRKTLDNADSLCKLQGKHDVALKFLRILELDGDGLWPPEASYENWPATLSPYKAIWNDAVRLIADPKNSISGNQNSYKIEIVRHRLKVLLKTSVELSKVNQTLCHAVHGNVLSQRQYNGFCCCIAYLRHAYRYDPNLNFNYQKSSKSL